LKASQNPERLPTPAPQCSFLISHFNEHVQKTKRWYLLHWLPFHQNVIATREMFCCDLAFGFQLHAARNLAPVQNIPSTLQATEGWGRLFFMALFYSRSMPAPRPAMINAGYTDTTHVCLVIGHTPWKMVNTLRYNQ
jgi:hypothetical protein